MCLSSFFPTARNQLLTWRIWFLTLDVKTVESLLGKKIGIWNQDWEANTEKQSQGYIFESFAPKCHKVSFNWLQAVFRSSQQRQAVLLRRARQLQALLRRAQQPQAVPNCFNSFRFSFTQKSSAGKKNYSKLFWRKLFEPSPGTKLDSDSGSGFGTHLLRAKKI